MGTIKGTNGDNQPLYGTSGNDTINALAGVDWIIGSTGNDLIDGGSGRNDVVFYESLHAGVFINNTSSQIGSVGAYRVLKAGGQQDTLVGVEAFHGSGYADTFYVGSNTYIFARGGNDAVHLGSGSLAFLGHGNDTVYGTNGQSALSYFDDGYDVFLQTNGIVAIWNSATSGIVTDDGWGNTDKFFGIGRINGSAFSDAIIGNIGNDQMSGDSGDDYLYGNGGTDALDGGDGNDMLFGGNDDDHLSGGLSDDSIFGGEGSNTLEGGEGNDVYFVQSDVIASDIIHDASGDADILQVLDTNGRDAYRFVYDGVYLVHETMQGHRTEIALDENGVPVVEYLQWMGSEEYGTVNYANTLRIIIDLANIFGGLIAVAGSDGADTIVMPNETAQDGEYWGEVYANAGDDIITLSSTIQYITYCGDGDDSVLGYGDMSDFVDGEAGNDAIDGYDGGDYLYGGADDDQLRGGNGQDLLDGGTTTADGEDELYGGDGDDTLIAQGVSTFLEGGAGNDLIKGSNGFEDLSYEAATSGVTVDLGTGLAEDGMGGTDTFFDIDQVIGSHFADLLIGDDEDNRFQALEGDDTINGGAGSDLVRYDREIGSGGFGAIVVDLANGWATDSWGDQDTLTSIENIRATNGSDSVTGSNANNNLQGNGGDDSLYGGGGHDTLEGGSGDDVMEVSGEAFTLNARGSFLYGGDGDDTLVSSQLSAWGAELTPGLGHNVILGSLETWNSGDGDNLGLYDLVNVGGVTVVQDLNGSGTVNSGDGLVVNTFKYIQFFQLTAEDDTIYFSDDAHNKSVLTWEGNDTIYGGSGVDDLFYGVETGRGISLDVNSGRVIDPWGFSDRFFSVESFRGSQDADILTASGVAFAVNLEGNSGNDTITGGNGADTLIGGLGDDKLSGGDGNDTIDDGVGFDTIDGGTGIDTFVRFYDGVDYSLVLGFDLTRGLAYSPLDPSAAAEVFIDVENLRVSGRYTFILTGSSANNVLETSAGNDSLHGLSGNDSLVSGDGNDTLDGGLGSDRMTGGNGNDTYVVDSSLDTIIELANGGIDLVQSSAATYSLGNNAENLTLTGNAAINGAGNSLSNLLTGNASANSISGGGGNDTIIGGGGNDILEGAAGNDSLVGGAGNDTLLGSGGNDKLTGGSGADVFVFNSAPNASSNMDTITDFVSGTDRINLAKSVMAALGNVNSTLIADAFWQGAGVVKGQDSSDRIVYNTSTGVLYYDADGSGSGAAVQLAQLGTTASHPATLTAADFFVL